MSREDDIAAVDRALTRIGRFANSRRAARRRSRAAGVELAPTAAVTLAAVHRLGPIRQARITPETGIEQSRVSKEMSRLLDAELVQRVADPSDRRAVLLTATEAGADALRRYQVAVDEHLALLLAGWSARDLRQLSVLLTRLADTVGVDDDR